MKYTINIQWLLLLFVVAWSSSSFAQDTPYVQGEILVRIDSDARMDEIANDLNLNLDLRNSLKTEDLVSPQMNIWLLSFDDTAMRERDLLDHIKTRSGVMEAQLNHVLTQRSTIPNDTDIGEQWHWINNGQTGGTSDADVDAELAWDLATGGVTANGDTIVVAVIDSGADFDHPDLETNYWRNLGEIRNNGIDDDGNGYIDDYLGWNDSQGNDDIPVGSHGTRVAGMIGAIGNNDNGVTGINWNVKIMNIVRESTTEAGAISAYTYALTQRQIYNQTNGSSGAFVVATNTSWGIDNGDPDDSPLWCDFYDTLGANGILSCGATANNNVDIDVVGDLPTGCASEYMIAVTATDHNDERTFSGFGATTIDLGAPGEDVYTTLSNGGYTTTSGTSFASPLVAGVIALLYSAPCSDIANLSLNSPEIAAQQVRDFIFQGVDPIADLANETVYGGRVNAYNSLQLLLSDCASCPEDITHTGTINSDTYKASNSITSTATIGNNQDVTYNAGNFICLNDVFLADASNGAVFLAHLGGCGVNARGDSGESTENKADESNGVTFKNYPNPFTGHTTIEFTLSKDTPVTLSVSDATGRQVEVLLNNEVKTEGTHLSAFDGSNYPAGMYYYTIQAGEYVGTQKMVLMK